MALFWRCHCPLSVFLTPAAAPLEPPAASAQALTPPHGVHRTFKLDPRPPARRPLGLRCSFCVPGLFQGSLESEARGIRVLTLG